MNIKKSLLVIAVSVSSTIVVANPFVWSDDGGGDAEVPFGVWVGTFFFFAAWAIYLWKNK
jgi:hypothetical protein